MPYATAPDGIRIHYVTEGDGPPLILHHGFTGSHRDWWTFGFVDALRNAYRLIMFDARGHGASDKPHDPARYGLEIAALDVVAVLDDLGIEQAHYYGYSFGGMIGWALGKYAPQRFASMIIGGAQPYPPPQGVGERFGEMFDYLDQGMEAYISWSESRVGPWPAEFRERGLQNDPLALRAFMSAPSSRDMRTLRFDDALKQMSMPVLLISGDNDERYAGRQAKKAAGCLTDGQYVEIPDSDHFKLYILGDRVMLHLRGFFATFERHGMPYPASDR